VGPHGLQVTAVCQPCNTNIIYLYNVLPRISLYFIDQILLDGLKILYAVLCLERGIAGFPQYFHQCPLKN